MVETFRMSGPGQPEVERKWGGEFFEMLFQFVPFLYVATISKKNFSLLSLIFITR